MSDNPNNDEFAAIRAKVCLYAEIKAENKKKRRQQQMKTNYKKNKVQQLQQAAVNYKNKRGKRV